MANPPVRYLLFDIESIADGDLVSRIVYPAESYTAQQAIHEYCIERLERTGSEFIPYTFHIPIAVAIIKIASDLSIIDIVTLDDDQYRPHVITKNFWDGWRAYKMPTLVSFNGRTFDIPLMELAAFRFGVSVGQWFSNKGPSYEQPRNRYNDRAHMDLQEVITNFGATRLNGGLNLMANLLGKPGKMGIAGHMVQELYNQGQLQRINDYCRCDVLDTYFVFLRTKVLFGEIDLEQEAKLVQQTQLWLEENSKMHPVYGEYLENWNDWPNPWLET